jgi:hypothetical protein
MRRRFRQWRERYRPEHVVFAIKPTVLQPDETIRVVIVTKQGETHAGDN